MSGLNTFASRAYQVLKWQIPLGAIVAWAWTYYAPRPVCQLTTEKPFVCAWPLRMSDSGYFVQDVWIAGLSIVAGLVAGRFLHRRLRTWGLLAQVLAAGSAMAVMAVVIYVDMKLNSEMNSDAGNGTGTGLLIARSHAAVYLWPFVTQVWVVLGSGFARNEAAKAEISEIPEAALNLE